MAIDEQHLDQPGLAVLDITAADEDTARVVRECLQQLWATSGVAPVRRVPGQARCPGTGVRRRTTPPRGSGLKALTLPSSRHRARGCLKNCCVLSRWSGCPGTGRSRRACGSRPRAERCAR
ncbi:DUF6207 family protein [Streptomyces sp. YS-3]|uniref:DUF6207 family protein n=1 Tax=Streptomyces sp. YS-3 TaxID=3381352 RepID=UPI003862CD32